uniref:Solute carrier family 12 member 3 n=1 Tax=Steinernema glaseri TaxID=37863 RepID=A0A1I7ZM91_9BILA
MVFKDETITLIKVPQHRQLEAPSRASFLLVPLACNGSFCCVCLKASARQLIRRKRTNKTVVVVLPRDKMLEANTISDHASDGSGSESSSGIVIVNGSKNGDGVVDGKKIRFVETSEFPERVALNESETTIKSLSALNYERPKLPSQWTNSYSSSALANPVGGPENDFSVITIDQPPTLTNYLTGKRPTMNELIKYQTQNKLDDTDITNGLHRANSENSDKESDAEAQNKFGGFGWIQGVLMRCILCIFGATLFLRMSWLGGQAGIVVGLGVLMLAFIVVILTAVSMSAIATNGEVGTGGCYYLISRSLGPEFGGSIGLIFYIANTVNASMNCVGLAEAIVFILKDHGFSLIDGGINDTRLYALLTCTFLQGIIFIGTEFESKTQVALLITLTVSILSHLVGTFLPLTPEQITRGVTGYSLSTMAENMWPDFRGSETFITVFGVYFPAMTGIMAGANMSGDLKDASKSIPKGTVWAIIITTGVYGLAMITTAMTTVRDSSGLIGPIYDNFTGAIIPPACRANDSCVFGLANDYQVMLLQGAFGPLIIAGIFASTLSSASGCLIGAPRVFQALCEDKLYPYIRVFAKGHGPQNEPYRAYVLTFFIATGIILIGDLNAIAIIITNFFLAAFAITNFACFDATAGGSPGFRPGFKYYNKWLSLFGSILCIAIMFVLSWITSLITFGIFAVLFLFIKNNKSHINWGSSTEANRYRKALMGLLKLSRTEEHVKNYRPQLLVLTGNPAARQALVDFAYCISKGQSLMICGHVVPYPPSVSATSCIRKLNHRLTDWLHEQKCKAFYCAVAHRSLRNGVQGLLQTVGLGKMQPNILMMGFKSDWVSECHRDYGEVLEYLGVIKDAFESNLSICIFRNTNEGLDHSALMMSNDDSLFLKLPDLMLSDSKSPLNDDYSRGVAPRIMRPNAATNPRKMNELKHTRSEGMIPHLYPRHNSEASIGKMKKSDFKKLKKSAPQSLFRTKVKNGVIDVWWLFDDGGLTLLIPYLLSMPSSYLHGAKMRIFTVCHNNVSVDQVRQKLEKMLKKFRIEFSQVIVLCDEDERELYAETVEEYEALLSSLAPAGQPSLINQSLQTSAQPRTMRYLRTRELLLEYSSASNLVIVTLPLAHRELVFSPLYMVWLEMLSKDMPPTLLVRGNQASVLTFYS